ncbi:hypothetical protein [Nitratifractor sp.]
MDRSLARVTFLICILYIASILHAQPSICPDTPYLELIRQGSGQWIHCLHQLPQKGESSDRLLKPQSDPYLITPKPKRFDKGGKMLYLFPLAPDGRYLDAAPYKRLRIDGTFPADTHIFLADRDHYLKESNIPVTLDNNQTIDLWSLWKRLDLRRLKYLVLLVPGKEKVSTLRLRFFRVLPAVRPSALSVWLWKPKNASFDPLEMHNLQALYIQMGPGFSRFARKAIERHKIIWGLDGDPHDIFDGSRFIDDLRTLKTLRHRFPHAVAGLQVDIEPYLLKDFSKNRDAYLKRYLQLIRELSQAARRFGLKLSVVIPFWFDDLYIDGKPIAFSVIDAADETVLMSYRNNFDDLLSISRDILAYASAKHKAVKLGIELKELPDENHTYYRILPAVPCLVANAQTPRTCRPLKKIRSYTVPGNHISLQGRLSRLLDIISRGIAFPSFAGYVLHDYEELEKSP